jgi:catechol 2,3-dioxygenase-like lactoylglutathione lyase family enzyme
VSKVILGNHSAVVVPRQARDRVRRFCCDVLGCEITREHDAKDDFRLGDDFYIAVLYGDVADESNFLTGKSIFLELKSDDVDGMRQRIVHSGVTVLDVPDPHLYFQPPGGQVFRLVGIDEDLSAYERGPDPGTARAVVRGAEHSPAVVTTPASTE